MRWKSILTMMLCGIVVSMPTLVVQAAPDAAPCQRIMTACLDAGFVRGGAGSGMGLKKDCINPIMQGRPPRGAALPLPWINPRLVAACSMRDPTFGQLGRAGARRFAAAPWMRGNVPPFAQSDDTALNGRRGQPYANPRPEEVPPAPAPQGALSGTTPDTRAPEATAQDMPAPAAPAPQAPPAASAPAASSQPPSNTTKRPNIIFVLTDDLAVDLVQYMPHVLKMQKDGITFANYFVTDSLCCPSRSSIFSGRYPHDTGIFTNKGADGGFHAFRNWGEETATFATALAGAGYRTAILGKYLNGYQPANPAAPGWSSWSVAGNGYREFNYSLNQDNKVVGYGNTAADYLTDVISDRAVRFIKQSGGGPFLIELATFAPHRPSTPAPRDADALPGVRAPRSPAFNAAPDANAVNWLRALPALSPAEIAAIDVEYRRRAQSVLAVDKMIGDLQAAVAAIGEENNTYFVFSSDNGYHMGEHRLLAGKMTVFDTDIHVPLIVTGPGVPAGATADEITQNIDLCPTFAELAGAAAPASVDGRSLVALLAGQKVPDWRTVALVEHHGPVAWDPADPDAMDLVDQSPYRAPNRGPWQRGQRHGNATTYEAIRGPAWVYVEYADGEKEYHDIAADPDELRNSFSSLSDAKKASLHAILAAVQNCHSAASCQAAEHPILSANQR
jgi:N-acetylglucosamine-6-sulfatase